ncbi:hypothetical protein F8388_025360 [Cannabis sativa]|uniref:Alpha-carbonic anhydrase domain-containing protein n=1 Tax=Cannabis sativa TaxID=3483 RepID=A0A7J6FSH0_CANSA|nr:hypothetical protein F8388_025360 [Cannabis sativa]
MGFFSFIFLITVHFIICRALQSESNNESPFSYNEGSGKGPKKWGHIDPHWKICNNGKLQSPIDLLHQKVQDFPNLDRAVVAITYKYGQPDPFLTKLFEHIKSVDTDLEEKDLGIINPEIIKFGSKEYYRYIGSLTIPPCTEGVIWTIFRKVRTVSREQVCALRNAVHDGFEVNARPTQQLNGRPVWMYTPRGGN